MLGLAARGCCALHCSPPIFSLDGHAVFSPKREHVSLQRSIWLGVFWLVTHVLRRCTSKNDGKGVCVNVGPTWCLRRSRENFFYHSKNDLPLHDQVVCPLLKDGEVHVLDFLHGFPRHVHGYFRGQSAFGYFPPSSTVGVGNPTGVLTNTRGLAHLSATALLIGLCPVFLHTQCCLKVLEHANKAAVDQGDKQDGIRGRTSAGEVHFAACFSDLEPRTRRRMSKKIILS